MRRADCSIHDANVSDAPALAALMVRSYAHAFGGILDAAALAQRDAAYFEARFREQWPMVRLAENAAGNCLGLTLVRSGHIDMIFVEPDRIGRGIGAALLRDAQARGAVSLECFRDNHQARNFYERMGWRLDRAYERPFAERLLPFVTYVRPSGV